MIQPESKTSPGVRIAILSIAVLMIVSTIALYFMIIIQDGNNRKDQEAKEQLEKEFSKLIDEHDDKVREKASELSEVYYGKFAKYKSSVRAFNAKAVTKLKTKDLVKGDGETIKDGTEYSAYYYAWLPDESIYGSSIDSGSEKKLLMPTDYGDTEGWREGVKGMKVGGVREITVPANMAYGDEGASDGSVPAGSPVKYIVMLIPKVDDIPYAAETVGLCTRVFKDTYGDEATAEMVCKMYYGNGEV